LPVFYFICYNLVVMEWLKIVLPWLQVILSVAIIAAVLMQTSDAGLGSAFGGGSGNEIAHTKRGLEKGLMWGTAIMAGLFVLLSIATLLINTA